VIREAQPRDVPVILQLVGELADYEREPESAVATAEQFEAALFGPDPRVFAHVVEVAGQVVGFALWYVTFSTWRGTHGLWLEDLFVRPGARGGGWGKALLQTLAGICVERGWSRFAGWVLDWNEAAQGFYRSLGARPEDEWTVWRVDGDALHTLGTT
jgi:GNAT superfamily N-acetyltransferase